MKIASRSVTLFTLFISFLVLSPAAFGECGKERWKVKVGQDEHVKYLFLNNDIAAGNLENPTVTTISQLHNKPYPFPSLTGRPPAWSYYQRATSGGDNTEFTIWTITARLTEKKNEADEDYHLILKSQSKYMVAEIPSVNCVAQTVEPLKGMIIKARQDFDVWKSTHPGSNFNQRVRITGIGFFDRIHGAEGSAPNGIELHPVIKIEFLN